jgi:hypothetical protein
LFANAATDFGSANSAPNPDDTECGTIIGAVAISTDDWVDMGGASIVSKNDIGLIMKSAATSSLWIAGVNGAGTPTYAAGSLTFKLGFER